MSRAGMLFTMYIYFALVPESLGFDETNAGPMSTGMDVPQP